MNYSRSGDVADSPVGRDADNQVRASLDRTAFATNESTGWILPSVYLDFLTRFSPVKVTLENKRFWNGGLRLFGAGDLIEAQEGYAYNPVKKKAVRGWPKDYVVIASHGGDPFVLDRSSSDGQDAPVLTAEHGTGSWEFDEYAESFEQFLKSLAK